jgi:pilus assembly protein Flp/PilA
MASAGRLAHDRGRPRRAPVRAPAQLSPGEAGQSFTTRPGHRDKEETMRELWNNFVKDESGQGLVEYVLIIALVAIGLIAIMIVFRNSIGDIFRTISDTLNDAPTTGYGS